ncbi:MAG: YlmC/YmxH family sporulation protein [Eubacteriales bacterium]|nr:YlmC/YmxH family sporulation protein [Eubacteriales bacterium]MDD4422268.1 YlmC/YmxH family sporulation protein [Eubacteriales bacterium]HBR30551.1 YlmC/YmxH family sporulation protein [Clostridiales bacterium]
MFCLYSSLKNKEVINIVDGRRLGCIVDLDVDPLCGKIIKIILPSCDGFFSYFSNKNNICIPWESIERIGDDIILVKDCDIHPRKKDHCNI